MFLEMKLLIKSIPEVALCAFIHTGLADLKDKSELLFPLKSDFELLLSILSVGFSRIATICL